MGCAISSKKLGNEASAKGGLAEDSAYFDRYAKNVIKESFRASVKTVFCASRYYF